MGAVVSKTLKSDKGEKTTAASELDQRMGMDRPAVKYGDAETEAKYLIQTAEKTAVEIEQFTGDTKTFLKMKSFQKKAPVAKAKKGNKKEISWRDRVRQAQNHTAMVISALKAMDAKFEFSQACNFIENMQFFLFDSLGDEKDHFITSLSSLQEKLRKAPTKVSILAPDPEEIAIREAEEKERRRRERAEAKKIKPRYLSGSKPKLEPVKKDPGADLAKIKRGAEESVIPDDILAVADSLVAADMTKADVDADELNKRAAAVYKEEMSAFGKEVRDDVQLLQSILHRSNAAKLSDQAWTSPHITDAGAWFNSPNKTMEVKEKSEMAIDFFRSGAVAIQVLAAGAMFRMQDGQKIPLWSADPYRLASKCLGQYTTDHVMKMNAVKSEMKGESGSMLEGMTMGPRHLASVVLALERLIGPQFAAATISKLKLVLHVSQEMENSAVNDLREHNYFGLSPANIVVVVQPLMPGFNFSHSDRQFKEDSSSPLRMYGTGFAMQQLTWNCEGYLLEGPGGKAGKFMLKDSVLTHLKNTGVEWMLSNRLNDMQRQDPSQAISFEAFCQTLYTRDYKGCAMSVQVEEVEVDLDIFLAGSVVVGHAEGGGDSPFVCEVPADACQSPEMSQLIERVKEKGGGKLWTSVDRYIFHVPTLGKVMQTHRIVPMMRLEEWEEQDIDYHETTGTDTSKQVTKEVVAAGKAGTVVKEKDEGAGFGDALAVYPFFDMADLTQVAKMRCVACKVAGPRWLEIKNLRFLESALSVVYRSDSQIEMHRMLDRLQRNKQKSLRKTNVGAKPRFTVVVFCQNDAHGASLQAAQTFLPLLTPGVDRVHLVHVVRDSAKIPGGQKLLMAFEPTEPIQCEKHVLLRPKDSALVDFMCYSARHTLEGNIVVMGSEGLSQYSKSDGVGSIALAMTRQCRQSLYVHKAGSYMPVEEVGTKRSSWCVGVHQSNLPLLKFVCKLLSADRDHIFLGRVTSTPEQEELTMRLVEGFTDQAISEGKKTFTAQKRGGKAWRGLLEIGKEELCNIVAIQVAQHLEPSDSVQEMVKEARCGIFMYKEKQERKIKTEAMDEIPEI